MARISGTEMLVKANKGLAEERDQLKAAVAELVLALSAVTDQAEGCWLNHYPGDAPYNAPTPEYLQISRSLIAKYQDTIGG